MLEKVVSAMKSNEAQTLQRINKGEFKKDDLYPFCGGPDGKFSANASNTSLVGQSLKDLKDKSGKAFGQELYKEAQTGKVSEVSYMWPRPGGTDPVQGCLRDENRRPGLRGRLLQAVLIADRRRAPLRGGRARSADDRARPDAPIGAEAAAGLILPTGDPCQSSSVRLLRDAGDQFAIVRQQEKQSRLVRVPQVQPSRNESRGIAGSILMASRRPPSVGDTDGPPAHGLG